MISKEWIDIITSTYKDTLRKHLNTSSMDEKRYTRAKMEVLEKCLEKNWSSYFVKEITEKWSEEIRAEIVKEMIQKVEKRADQKKNERVDKNENY